MVASHQQTELSDTRSRIICRRCGSTAERVRRGAIIKYFLPWLNVKRFYCAKCLRKFYIKD